MLSLVVEKRLLGVFSNPVINSELSLGKNPLNFDPRYEDAVVVFFDMRGFTTISEKLDLIQFTK